MDFGLIFVLKLYTTDFGLIFITMAEFILETNYPSRRIIRQTDNSSKYKSEDEF